MVHQTAADLLRDSPEARRELARIESDIRRNEAETDKNRRQRSGGGGGQRSGRSRPQQAGQSAQAESIANILAEYQRLLESGRGGPDDVTGLVARINALGGGEDAERLLTQVFDDWEGAGSPGKDIVVEDEVIDEDIETVDEATFFNEEAGPTNPLARFAAPFGIDPEDPANAGILPDLREAFASSTSAGRSGLFGGAVDEFLPIGGPDILRSAFSGLGDRASTNFLFQNALGRLDPINIEGGPLPQGGVNLGSSFTNFLAGPGSSAFGNFGGDVSEFLSLAEDPNALAFQQEGGQFNPAAFNLRQQLVNNPGSAFDFIGSQFQGPTFSPFGGAAARARERIFGQFQRDNPNQTGLDFLRQFGQGDFSGLF